MTSALFAWTMKDPKSGFPDYWYLDESVLHHRAGCQAFAGLPEANEQQIVFLLAQRFCV